MPLEKVVMLYFTGIEGIQLADKGEVFKRGEGFIQGCIFGDVANSLFRLQSLSPHVKTQYPNASRKFRDNTGHDFYSGTLTCPIRPDVANYLTGLNNQAYTSQYVVLEVKFVEVNNLNYGRALFHYFSL
jgi:hypothetical protein